MDFKDGGGGGSQENCLRANEIYGWSWTSCHRLQIEINKLVLNRKVKKEEKSYKMLRMG